MPVAVDRPLGEARDGRVALASASNTRYQTAKEDRALALDAVEDAALATLQLCRPGQSKSACREARAAETAARERLAAASAAYVAAGAPVVADVLATRLVLVAHLMGVTLRAEHVTMIQPMLAPLFLQLGSVVAFAFGFAPVLRRAGDVSRRQAQSPMIIDVKARDVSRHVSQPAVLAEVSEAEINRALAALRRQTAPVSNVEPRPALRHDDGERQPVDDAARARGAGDAGEGRAVRGDRAHGGGAGGVSHLLPQLSPSTACNAARA